MPAPNAAVPATESRSTDAALVRLVALHGAACFVPAVLVLALVTRNVLAAVLVALVVAAAATAWRLRGIDERLARSLGARPLTADESPRLHNLAENIAMATGVGTPALHVIDDPAHNAVVWGSGNGPVSFAITTGLLDAAERVELEAILAYHLSMARDGIEVLSVAAGLFGSWARGPLAGPVASFVHSTVDERRIVLADIEGAQATCYPPGLERALELLVEGGTEPALAPPALAPLFFATPVAADSPFAVHPPVADRIDLVREL